MYIYSITKAEKLTLLLKMDSKISLLFLKNF